MLGVSLKLSENIDVVQPLNRYITSHYTENESKTVAKSISDINLTRQRLVQFLQRNENDHIQALDFFTNYYKSLLILEQHFPFGKESQSSILGIKTGKVPTVKIPFTWFGSFRHSKKTMEYDLALEKSAILFNIGALYSRQATKVKSGATAKDDSGLKEACGYFTQASGVFEMMASTPEITSAGQWDPDLTVEALQMLARLMLAQAQACFFEKATTSASPKLVAKLAAGVSELFRQTHALCESPRLKQFFTSDMYPWDAHLQYQIHCYQAAAFYWQAKQLLSEDEYGAEIAHLEKAKRVVESAKRFEGQLLKTLADNRQKLEANIVARLNAANKDNETIYFVQIPKPDTVRDIEGIINVKVVPFNVTPGEDHFTSLVPPQVREGAQAFQTQLRDALSTASKHATESTNYAKMHLSSLNLPAALEAMEPAKGIPTDVWTQVEDAKYKGGPAALATLNDNIASATMDAEQQHQHIVDTLAKESADDRTMRTQFAHKWNRKPSEQITVQFQRDVDAIAGYLRDAAASNNKVRTDWSTNLDQLEILTLSREQVEANLPQEQGYGEEKTEASENLRRLLDQLSHLLSERDRIITQQTSIIESYNIIPILISQRSRPQETIFAEELTKLDVKSQLDPLEKQQEELLAQITIASEHFEKTRAKNDTALARQRVIQSLNVAAQIFNRLLANFSEGLKFYSELIATKIVPLKQRVDDFIIARDLEKRMILEQLTKDAAGYQEEKHDVRPASAISGAIPYPTMPAPASTVATNPNNILDDKNTHPQYVFTAPPAHNPEVVTHEMNKMSVSPQPTPTPTPTSQPIYSPPPVQSPPPQQQSHQQPQPQPQPQQPAYQAPVYQPPPQTAIQHPTYTPPVQPQVQHQPQQVQTHQPQQPQQHHVHVPPPSYQQWQQPQQQPQQQQPQQQPQHQPQPQAQPQYQVPQYQAPAYQQPAYQPQQAHPQPAFQPNPFQHYPPPQQQQQQQHPQYQPYQPPQSVPQYQPPPTQQPQQASGKWNCKACTFENTGTGAKCSMCDTPRS